jgi:hypothetical protein
MDLIRRSLKAIAFALLPLVLVASMVCVCASASAAEAPGAPGHPCCADGAESTPQHGGTSHEHRADCNHCGQEKIAPGEMASIPVPGAAPAPWMPASAAAIEIVRPACTTPTRARGARDVPHPMGPVFSLNCSLLI